MIVYQCAQGTPEWHASRSGVITASMFSTVRAKVNGLTAQQQTYVTAMLEGRSEAEARAKAEYKAAPRADAVTRALRGESVGDWSLPPLDYAFKLAVERISGEPLDQGFETWSMRRGHELEPDARMEHEMQTGLVVQEAGFVTPTMAPSAQRGRPVGEDGGAEYKCFVAPEKLRSFHIDNDASDVFDQVQGCMWVTGRKWWHIGLYCPALKPAGKQLWWREFKRDDDYIEAMESDLWAFKLLVDGYEEKLRTRAA
jgi:hypothetical protein